MKNKKRILFVLTRFLDGGIDTILLEYLNYIVKKGDYNVTLAIGIYMRELEVFIPFVPKEVEIIYINKSSLLTKIPTAKVKGTTNSIVKSLDEIFLNPIRRIKTKLFFKQEARRYDVIVDFACSYPSFMGCIKNVKKIGFYHFSLSDNIKKIRKKTEKRFDKYDKIVTVSKDMEKQFIKAFPHLSTKIEMIYNAKDLNALQDKVSKIPQSPIEGKYLLAMERLEESQKDISTLLHAMKILKEKYLWTTPLYILGKGKSETQLKELAKSLGVEKLVFFVGFTPNPYPWLKHCTLLLHSAKFEGFGLALMEGLLLDKFIICSDCPTGPREILDNGKAGILVPVGDARSFAAAIINLMGDKELQTRIKQGIEAHKHMFTFEDTYTQFKNLITELA